MAKNLVEDGILTEDIYKLNRWYTMDIKEDEEFELEDEVEEFYYSTGGEMLQDGSTIVTSLDCPDSSASELPLDPDFAFRKVLFWKLEKGTSIPGNVSVLKDDDGRVLISVKASEPLHKVQMKRWKEPRAFIKAISELVWVPFGKRPKKQRIDPTFLRMVSAAKVGIKISQSATIKLAERLVRENNTLSGLIKAFKQAGIKVITTTGHNQFAVTFKEIPMFGIGFGVALAITRIIQNPSDKVSYAVAGAELLSGALCYFPGAGTATSLAIDVAVLLHDLS
jgi:uncharacterized protein (DUF302 family)